jgi:Icc-related predicted phosphoesterase
MKMVFISDTHGLHHHLTLPEGDVLVHAGDFSKRGRPDEVADFMQWFGQQYFEHRICIAGNHDFMAENYPDDFLKLVPDNVAYLNDSGVEIAGVRFWGSPITPWFFDWAFNRQRGAEIRPHWALIPPETNVLITHGPPYGILDRVVRTGNPVGCRDLGKKILEIKPALHVFGHIHEGHGDETHDGVRYLNVSTLDEHYRMVHKPVVVVYEP